MSVTSTCASRLIEEKTGQVSNGLIFNLSSTVGQRDGLSKQKNLFLIKLRYIINPDYQQYSAPLPGIGNSLI
jgi:hypothetical protein